MPAGKIGAGDIADLPTPDQRIEGLESLLHRSQRIEAMHVVDVNIIRAQAAQTRFAGA